MQLALLSLVNGRAMSSVSKIQPQREREREREERESAHRHTTAMPESPWRNISSFRCTITAVALDPVESGSGVALQSASLPGCGRAWPLHVIDML